MYRLPLIVPTASFVQSPAHRTPLLAWPQSTRLLLLLAVSLTLPMAARTPPMATYAYNLSCRIHPLNPSKNFLQDKSGEPRDCAPALPEFQPQKSCLP